MIQPLMTNCEETFFSILKITLELEVNSKESSRFALSWLLNTSQQISTWADDCHIYFHNEFLSVCHLCVDWCSIFVFQSDSHEAKPNDFILIKSNPMNSENLRIPQMDTWYYTATRPIEF